ncbi:peptidoglycan-binding protein [Streptomyces tuirus]|uniref:Peptidoglycan-binding protein n=1 Tax=Streptomyces tuirus TaxID=68278 RepID=A0A941FA14_9ACTN|nr:peptidoglycan-binding protein [Streptomyces tuirus]
MGAGLDEDGDFGRVTQSATEDFQRCADIVVDGRIGAQTWSFLSFWAHAPGAPFFDGSGAVRCGPKAK